jgi:KipI family sensor histidine kinase inhibitor
VRLVEAGDAVLIAEFGERIDPELNARVVALSRAVSRERVAGVRDVVPTFRTVAVYFDPSRTDVHRLATRLRELSTEIDPAAAPDGAVVEIPVCYGGELGPDLDDVARFAGVSASDVITLHTARSYRAFMLGFLPGFAYLGIVDRPIAAPRRGTPRRAVAAGSVGIAGEQTGVYPRVSPGGWNIIGRTPLPMFVASRQSPSLIQPGDSVRFHPIDRADFDRASAAAGAVP